MGQGTFEQYLAKLFVYQGMFLDPDIPRGWKIRLGPQGAAGAPTSSGKELFSLEDSHTALGCFPSASGDTEHPASAGLSPSARLRNTLQCHHFILMGGLRH